VYQTEEKKFDMTLKLDYNNEENDQGNAMEGEMELFLQN